MRHTRTIQTCFKLGLYTLALPILVFAQMACEKGSSPSPPISSPPPEVSASATLSVSDPNPSHSPEDGIVYHVESWKEDGWGICTPNCNGRECGPNECGGLCGTCDSNEFCTLDGQCLFGGISPESCMTAAPCMIDCGIDDACLSECNQSLEPPINTAYDVMIDCLTTECIKCMFAPNMPNCILGCGSTTCVNTWEPCLSGTLQCHEVLSCMSSCDGTIESCTSACIFNGSIHAQIQIFELNQCWEEICGINGPKTCKAQAIYEECSAPYFACREVSE